MDRTNVPQEFESIRDRDETILWIGRPELLPFLAKGLPFLIGGLAWGTFDLVFLTTLKGAFSDPKALRFLVPFFAFHMLPLWLSILNVVRLRLVYGNTVYGYSNKRVMMRSGFLGTDFKTIDYDKISDLQVSVGVIDRMFGVGTIRPATAASASERSTQLDKMIAIPNPYEVMKKIKECAGEAKTQSRSND